MEKYIQVPQKIKKGDQDDRVGHGAHLPPIKKKKIDLHLERFSQIKADRSLILYTTKAARKIPLCDCVGQQAKNLKGNQEGTCVCP